MDGYTASPVLSRIGLRSIAVGLVLAALAVAPAAAAPHIDGEFTIPGSELGTNNKITSGPDGNVWVTLASGKDVARITPGGEVTEYDLEATNPLGITTGPEGNLWITQNNGVTKFSPSAPEASKKFIENNVIIGQHSIVAGPEGNLWVATEGNLVRVEPGTEETKAFEVVGLAPKDIDVAGSVLAIASQERIVTATPADPPVTTDFKIEGSSQGVAGSPSGQIAFSDPLAIPEQIGLITPPNAPQTMNLPGDPFGVAFAADGAFWIAQAGPPEQLTRLTTDGQTSPLGGFAEGFHPRQITAGPGGTVWVTLENNETSDKVGRISGVEPPAGGPHPPSGVPETKITKGPKKKVFTRHARAKVKFKFTSSSTGATFECALTKLKKSKKAKQRPPRFAACKSPKVYKLKPGRYRFEVRAVLATVADQTPAKRTFRVLHRR